MTEQDTGALVDRASRGDSSAIEDLLGRWMPAVERYLRARAPRDVLARESGRDLAQSVCRDALERIGRGAFEYRGEAEFKQWLFGAADLKLKNRWRYVNADKRAPEQGALGLDDAAAAGLRAALDRSRSSPSGAAVRAEEGERFLDAIGELDERGREVLTLFHLDGLGHAEIAARLGIAESHSRTILARALARLARLLRQ